MSEIRLVIARADHIPLIAARMRPEDRAEVWASDRLFPEEVLRLSLRNSEWARVAFVDADPLAIFGVCLLPDAAVPWVLTTDAVCKYPLTFYRSSKAIFREIREAYPLLAQAIDARYTSAISWAKRLGFTVGEPLSLGKRGEKFLPITLKGEG